MIKTRRLSPSITVSTALALVLSLFPVQALAAPGGGAGLPWESTFSTILDSVQGIAPIFVTIAIIIAGLALMFGEAGGMSRRVVTIVVGGATVMGVATVVSTLFEGASGVLF